MTQWQNVSIITTEIYIYIIYVYIHFFHSLRLDAWKYLNGMPVESDHALDGVVQLGLEGQSFIVKQPLKFNSFLGNMWIVSCSTFYHFLLPCFQVHTRTQQFVPYRELQIFRGVLLQEVSFRTWKSSASPAVWRF